jgi:hypothetical protein
VIVLFGVTEILDIVHRVRLKPIKLEGKGKPPSSGASENGGEKTTLVSALGRPGHNASISDAYDYDYILLSERRCERQ